MISSIKTNPLDWQERRETHFVNKTKLKLAFKKKKKATSGWREASLDNPFLTFCRHTEKSVCLEGTAMCIYIYIDIDIKNKKNRGSSHHQLPDRLLLLYCTMLELTFIWGFDCFKL